MEPKETYIFDFKIDWRFLLVIGIIVCILALAYSAVSAQGEDQLITNNYQEETTTAPLEQDAPSEIPELDCSDGYLPTTNGECIPADSLGAQLLSTADVAAVAASGGGGSFYLTDANYTTDQPLTACASGYHMASLWEILDVSNATYAYSHPAAHVKTDSGNGPPSGWYGWVRTGWASSDSSTTGTGNCLNWSSIDLSDYGVAVRLATAWETAPGDISTWDATSFTCNFNGPVWCVSD